jgi:hypothetical protein
MVDPEEKQTEVSKREKVFGMNPKGSQKLSKFQRKVKLLR